MDITNPLSNMSYTQKDFQTIYPELLDLVKKLTNRWDPSISNESDPGVILLKLNALIADKNNYNIDKNVLECFPASVTQENNARQLFEQMGYNMSWYKGATADISIKWKSDVYKDDAVTIPRFTTICDVDSTIVYTTIESKDLNLDGTPTTIKAIQGTPLDYDINGEMLIRPSDLDYNNRLYFLYNNVAQNGIFIKNIDQENYDSWEARENLIVEELGQKVYKFGIDSLTNSCYIEFPEDVDELFGEGINIKYLRTEGYSGIVAAKQITDVFQSQTLTSKMNQEISFETDNLIIYNIAAAIDGCDPEDIDSAYKNYKKTVGTFKTLVTLRDYINFINTNEFASNSFVCDRTNDIQTSTVIVNNDNGLTSFINYCGKTQVGKPSESTTPLNAFDLKMYLLNYVSNVETESAYNSTFDYSEKNSKNIQAAFDDIKSIQHNFVEPIKKDIGTNIIDSENIFKILFFKNRYPLDIKVIPHYKLTDDEKVEVFDRVRKAIFNSLNAKEIDFGNEVSYDYVYDVLSNCDERINYVVLDNIDYETYAVIYDGTEIKEIRIDGDHAIDNPYKELPTENNLRNEIRATVFAKNVLAGRTPLYKQDTNFVYALNQTATNLSDEGEITTSEIKEITTNTDIEFTFSENNSTSEYKLKDSENIQFYAVNLEDKETYSNYVKYEYVATGQTASSNPYIEDFKTYTYSEEMIGEDTNGFTNSFQLRLKPGLIAGNESIKDSISVYLFVATGKDKAFKYEWPKKDVEFDAKTSSIVLKSSKYTEQEVSDANTLQLINSILSFEQSDRIKIKYYPCTGSQLDANKSYQLKDGEYITFFWKASDTDNFYTYKKYGAGKIICPSFILNQTNTNYSQNLKVGSGTIQDISINEGIKEITRNVLSSNNTVIIKEKNEVVLDNANTNYYFYFITNTVENDNYVLNFEEKIVDEKYVYEKILGANEYFLYTNSSKEILNILGSGTRLSLVNSSKSEQLDSKVDFKELKIMVPKIDFNEIDKNGINAFEENDWYNSTKLGDLFIKAQEQQFISIGADSYVLLTAKESVTEPETVKFNNLGIMIGDNIVDNLQENYFIQYKTGAESTYSVLPEIDVDGLHWQGKSILNISCSNDVGQRLYGNQSIEYVLKDDDDVTGKIEGSDEASNYIFSNIDLNLEGGRNIAVTYMVLGSNEEQYLQLYTYKQNDDISGYNPQTNIIKGTNSSNPIEIANSVKLPTGDYLLPIFVSSEESDISLQVYRNDTPLTIKGTLSSEVRLNEINYLELSVDTEEFKISISNANESNIEYTIYPLYKYSNEDRSYLGENELNSIIEKIKLFDVDNKFYWDYSVPEDILISNPLSAKSFFDLNHVYNKFTIPQIKGSVLPMILNKLR